METVKFNFDLELPATLIHDLYNGLCLELQALCKQVSHKAFTSTRLPKGFPAGWSIYVLLRCLFMSFLENTQFSQTVTVTVKLIYMFFQDVLQDDILLTQATEHIKA